MISYSSSIVSIGAVMLRYNYYVTHPFCFVEYIEMLSTHLRAAANHVPYSRNWWSCGPVFSVYYGSACISLFVVMKYSENSQDSCPLFKNETRPVYFSIVRYPPVPPAVCVVYWCYPFGEISQCKTLNTSHGATSLAVVVSVMFSVFF